MLTIHVGLTKTGSSSIQKALQGMSATELGGVRYRGRASPANNDGFYGRPAYHFQVPSRARETPTERLLSRGHHVVLSEEGFFGHPYVPNVAAVHSHSAVAASAMREHFLDKTPFQIVIYLRAQHEWLESLYNQYIKSVTNGVDSTEFAERAIDSTYFNWARLINDLKEQVGPDRLVVRAYRPDINVIEDFLTVLGVSTPERFLNPERKNSSLTPERLALRTRINSVCDATDDGHLAYWAARLDEASISPPIFPRTSHFTEKIQARLIKIAAADWQCLQAAVANTHRPEMPQFESVAQDAQQSQVKPYVGSLADVSIEEEAIRLLIQALPYVATHPKTQRVRVKNLVAAASDKARYDPRDVPRATISFLRQMYSGRTWP